jgi:charged multivesicular body protein 7
LTHVLRTTSKISNALRQQRQSIALAELRFKKHLEDLLSKRLGSLHNLESTLISVETAAGDVEASSCSFLYFHIAH